MVVAVVMTAAFFALIPRTQRFWTKFGQYTLYVYLLHTFLLYPLRETDIVRDLRPAELWLPVVIAGAVLLAMALATKPVRTFTRPLIEPRPRWLFADPSLVAREGHGRDETWARRTRGDGDGRSAVR
jgi:fucose 4-O-acetylase-like acetyltransferase